mgnify:CR=1 FL=1
MLPEEAAKLSQRPMLSTFISLSEAVSPSVKTEDISWGKGIAALTSLRVA